MILFPLYLMDRQAILISTPKTSYVLTMVCSMCRLYLTSPPDLKSVKKGTMSCLVWLSGLIASLQTEGSLVQFPVRAHAWVVGQVPIWGCAGGSQLMFLSLFLLPFPSL